MNDLWIKVLFLSALLPVTFMHWYLLIAIRRRYGYLIFLVVIICISLFYCINIILWTGSIWHVVAIVILPLIAETTAAYLFCTDDRLRL
jgi:hypothetical protein